jgi:hypothetical protein
MERIGRDQQRHGARFRELFAASNSPDSLDVVAMDDIDEPPRANTVSDGSSAPVGSGSAGAKKKRRLTEFADPIGGTPTRPVAKVVGEVAGLSSHRGIFVDADDITRLDGGVFFNDDLISFYLRHLQAELERDRTEVLQK